jgi:hypothetical protein
VSGSLPKRSTLMPLLLPSSKAYCPIADRRFSSSSTVISISSSCCDIPGKAIFRVIGVCGTEDMPEDAESEVVEPTEDRWSRLGEALLIGDMQSSGSICAADRGHCGDIGAIGEAIERGYLPCPRS